MAAGRDRAGDVIAWCVRGVQHAPAMVVIIALIISAAAALYTSRHLGIHTDTADMIAPETPFMRIYRDYKDQFPVLADSVTVVIEADTPDRARDAVDVLAARLSASPMFPHVHVPGGGPFFAQNGLLLLDRDELLDLLDSLADAQPLLQRLRQDMSLRGLVAVLGLGIDDARAGRSDAAGLDLLFARMAETANNVLAGRPAQLSWWDIMSGRAAEAADRRGVIVVQPAATDFEGLMPGATALAEIRRIAIEAGLTPANGVTMSLTGGLALAHDELATVQRGAALAGLLSIGLVTVILMIGLGSLRLVLVSLATLLIGLIWTAGFAALAIGHLNMISVAFAVLFVSLGIDFSIHLCLRARELIRDGTDPREAVTEAARSIGGSLALCAVSTAVGLYAFLPTDYAGVSELGLIAGTGMSISLITNLTVLPALLTLWPARARRAAATDDAPLARRGGWPARNARTVRLGAGALALGALALLPGVAFDINPINLQDPDVESVRTLRRLMDGGSRALWAAATIAPDQETADALALRFESLETVDYTVSLADYVPDDLADRLDLIADIAAVTEPDAFAISSFDPPSAEDQRRALTAFTDDLGDLDGARALKSALVQVLETGEPRLVESLEQALIGALPARLAALDTALTAAPFTMDDLPADLVERLRGATGVLRLQIYPAEDIAADNDALRRFVADLRTVDETVTAQPVILLEAGNTVIGAFAQALITAVAIIALILIAVTRRLADAAIILAPLALAALLTGAATVITGLSFNFANIIVLPLLMGIGVDSAIHLAHRHRHGPDRPLLATSTARGVLFSALTTVAGFGALAISPHLGTASMGLLLMIGVGFTLLCTLVLLPALLARKAAP
jgi:hopanoid biosynthesis associated RND transporter like protein HpnN